jgi:hypothetical protein
MIIIPKPPLRTEIRHLWKLDRRSAVAATIVFGSIWLAGAVLAFGAWILAEVWHTSILVRAVPGVLGTCVAPNIVVRQGLRRFDRRMAAFNTALALEQANRPTGVSQSHDKAA